MSIAAGFFSELEKTAKTNSTFPFKLRLKVPPISSMQKLPGQGGMTPRSPGKINPNGIRVKSAPGMSRKVTGQVGPTVRSSAMNPASVQNATSRALAAKTQAGMLSNAIKQNVTRPPVPPIPASM